MQKLPKLFMGMLEESSIKASEFFKTQRVNYVNQKTDQNGITTTKIFKHSWKRAYTFKAKNLNGKDEQILEDEEIEE